MKVAIIGAGLSGLSCAIELKRNGIVPVVFEKSGQIGDLPAYLVTVLRLFHRSLRSPMKYLEKKYGIKLSELNRLNEIVMIGPGKRVTVRGRLGYVFTKGPEPASMESQLAAQADVPFVFNTYIDINGIMNDFDYIVIASGSYLIPEAFNVWHSTFRAHARIATVEGDFKPGWMKMWLNKDYGRNGYGYLSVKSRELAELVLIVSDIERRELDGYWTKFIEYEHIDYRIAQISDNFYNIGFARPVRLGKLLFIGNTGGMIDNFLGFGSVRAIESGVIAARSIACGLDYARLIEPLRKDVEAMYAYRKMLNSLDNEDYDKLLTIIGLPGLKQALYNNPFLKVKHVALLPKLISSLKNK